MEKLSSIKDLPLSPVMSNSLFRWLLLLAIFSFSAIWFVDLSSGIIASFDASAYPICIASFIIILCSSFMVKSDKSFTVLHFLTYAVVAGFLISSSSWHHMAKNGLYSNSAQWLGLNYVIAYLFLDVKKAGPTTLAVFVTTLTTHYFALAEHNEIGAIVGVLANIAIANLVYMILLWTVLKMRVDGEVVHQKAHIMEHYAHIDELTKLNNRRGLERLLKQADLQWHNKHERYSIMIIDIDHFKSINDMYGHIMGDSVLTRFAHLVSNLLPHNADMARWGGEEFIILIRKTSPEEAMNLAEEIRSFIEHQEFEHQSPLTVSIGVSHCDEEKSYYQILQISDYNLYSAKHRGRNCIMDSEQANNLTRTPAPIT